MMSDRLFRVLFLSQRNSARSIMAAALLNTMGHGKFEAWSAGVRPAEQFDPIALELLDHAKIPRPAGQPRHYLDFAQDEAVALDFVFTLSDTAAGEPMPQWPGQPVTAHWGCTDPERFPSGSPEQRRALIDVRAQLERRLRVFLNLPFESLDRMSLQKQLDDIGARPE